MWGLHSHSVTVARICSATAGVLFPIESVKRFFQFLQALRFAFKLNEFLLNVFWNKIPKEIKRMLQTARSGRARADWFRKNMT
jgi:hypothetical protein